MKSKNFPGRKYLRRMAAYQRMVNKRSDDMTTIKNLLPKIAGSFDDYRKIRTKKDRSNRAKIG